jgi:hypothetical protein
MAGMLKYSIIAVGVVALLNILTVWQFWMPSSIGSFASSADTSVDTVYNNDLVRNRNTLRAGDLPGYTGWARPASTLAGSFRMERPCSLFSLISTAWTCSVRCTHEECQNGGSLFYVRAYGPAILPGEVVDHGNGVYDVTFLPLDEGVYTVEAVLTFSKSPAFSTFPLEKFTEPVYEGYMLPDFPLTVSVVTTPELSTRDFSTVSEEGPLRLCNAGDILDSGPRSAIQKGRWVVQERMIDRPFSLSSHFRNASLDGYERGENSLGIRMEYRPTHCSLLDEATFKDIRTSTKCRELHSGTSPRYWRIIMIGDSNMRAQYALFGREAFFNRWPFVNYLSTMDGIVARLPVIRELLRELLVEDEQNAYPTDSVVLFNTGLHDILFLCGNNYFNFDSTGSFEKRTLARCADTYRQKLTEFVHLMKEFTSVMTVFQTTTAAWPKWGVYGAAWLPNITQPLPFTPDFAKYFNDIAWDVMKKEGIPVMDTYWMTYSRPDHREVTETNKLSGKMAHAGPEVYSVLVRQWMMMMLQVFCPSLLEIGNNTAGEHR